MLSAKLRRSLLAATCLAALVLVAPAVTAQEYDQGCLDAGGAPEQCMIGGGEVYEEPVYEEPVYEEPVYEEPVYEEPVYEEPVYEEPVYEEPLPEELPIEEPLPEELPVEEPLPEELPIEEPLPEELPIEQPVEEEVIEEEPLVEEESLEEQLETDELLEGTPPDGEEIVDETVEEEVTEGETEEETGWGGLETETDEPATGETEVDGEFSEEIGEGEEGIVDEATEETGETDETEVLGETDETSGELAAGDFASEEVLTEDPLEESPEVALTEATEPLPEGVPEEQATPLLDSSKEGDYTEEELAAAEEAVAPATEEEARVEYDLNTEQVEALTVEGEVLEQAPEFAAPQNVTIINQTNNQFIYEVNNQVVINNTYQEQQRIYASSSEYGFDQIGDNMFRETVYRDDGSQVVTVMDQYGNILERYVVDPHGDQYVLAYFDRQYYDELQYWRDPGDDLPPIFLTISYRDYVLDWRYADEDEIYFFFMQPPVEKVRRLYSIDEVKRSARLRDSVRRLEVGNLNFATGSAKLPQSQTNALRRIAQAMLRVLEENPAETFLIEGHTDAVGTDRENLMLSDQRANAVARALTQYFGIPPENLATQGYGERYLRVNTRKAEQQNRRVTIRRITALVSPIASR